MGYAMGNDRGDPVPATFDRSASTAIEPSWGRPGEDVTVQMDALDLVASLSQGV